MSRHIIILILLVAGSLLFSQSVVINEFLASNDNAGSDPNGDFDDWIELYNIGTEEVDLTGWHLSDKENDHAKWTFPAMSINPGEYLAIWCDEEEDQGDNHTNFKISASGEAIILSDTELNVIDEITFGVQVTDISMGRYPNGSGDFVQMYPTFLAENESDYLPAEDTSSELFLSDVVYRYDLHFDIENWADTLAYWYDNGEEYIPVQVTFNDTLVLENVGVRYKGNSSYVQSINSPKKPFKMKFDEYDGGELLHGVSKLNFSNCINDPSFLREVLSYEVARKITPSSRTAFANIYVDGELLGFYTQVEQIDEYFITQNFEDLPGNLYKAADDGATMLYNGSDQEDYYDEYELKTNEGANDWSDLVQMLDDLNNCSNDELITLVDPQIDLKQAAQMLAFSMVLSNFDSYPGSGRNFYLYHNQITDRLQFIPWDMNESFGAYKNNWDVINLNVLDIPNLEDRPLNKRILENSSLREDYLDEIRLLLETFASYDTLSARIDELKAFIDPYVMADPNKFYSYQDFLTNSDDDVMVGMGQTIPGLRTFIQERADAIWQQISVLFVYPGDCDNNGMVDEYDILPIGINFLLEGAERDNISFNWQSFVAEPWAENAATYADANGDGIIDENDVIGIGVNWGNEHQITGASYGVSIDDIEYLQQYRSEFEELNNALSGNSESVQSMKSLLQMIFDFPEDISPPAQYLKNYPNPFNPMTTIYYSVTDASQQTNISIYNLKGRKVKTLINSQLDAGEYSLSWNGEDEYGNKCASGIFFCRFTNGAETRTNKITLLK